MTAQGAGREDGLRRRRGAGDRVTAGRWTGAAVLLCALAAFSVFAPSAIARHHVPRPQLSWKLPTAIGEGEPIPFSWSGRHLGEHHKLVVQRPVGTAHVWKAIMRLPSDQGTAELLGMALGRYRLRIADLALVPRPKSLHHRRPHFRVLAKDAAGIGVFGQVPFSTLFNTDEHEHVYTAPQFSFPYVVGWNSLDAEAGGGSTVFKVDRNACMSAHIAFVAASRETAKGTGTLTLVQESRDAVSATVAFNTIGSLDAELTPGQSWAVTVDLSTSIGDAYLNGSAVCDSAEPFS
jgi:hypothetical protein